MKRASHFAIGRRRILAWTAGVAVCAPLPGFGQLPRPPRAGAAVPFYVPPTPSCPDEDPLTQAQTEGPYFKPNSPKRADLWADGGGDPIWLEGFVMTRPCTIVPGALIELWHADDDGAYDAAGYRFRGHQFTDADGFYRFRTAIPGLYPGRTRHYHVKVQAPGGPMLTTQLYFPDDPGNESDRLFSRSLVMALGRVGVERTARFDFVVRY